MADAPATQRDTTTYSSFTTTCDWKSLVGYADLQKIARQVTGSIEWFRLKMVTVTVRFLIVC